MVSAISNSVIPVTDLRAYFIEALRRAAGKHHIDADSHVILYLGDLLIHFSRSEHLFDQTEDGTIRLPLVEFYRLAIEAKSPRERALLLRRMGDQALFITGVLPDSLERSLIDVDYYVAMGASAYGCLSDMPRADDSGKPGLFEKLSRRFVPFTDMLAETVNSSRSNPDLMRLYERWRKTGSPRLYAKLNNLGLMPVPISPN